MAVKLFCLVNCTGGVFPINEKSTPYYGYVAIENLIKIGNWKPYIISGTAAQLAAINALPAVVGLVAVTEAEGIQWPEMEQVVAAAVRTKINIWLTNNGHPTIPATWTNRQMVQAIMKRLNDKFDFGNFGVARPQD